MKIIYPKGSIIGQKKDNQKYCIIDINENGYEVVLYPVGMTFAGEHKHIDYDDVEKLYFWGFMDENYKQDIIKMNVGDK